MNVLDESMYSSSSGESITGDSLDDIGYGVLIPNAIKRTVKIDGSNGIREKFTNALTRNSEKFDVEESFIESNASFDPFGGRLEPTPNQKIRDSKPNFSSRPLDVKRTVRFNLPDSRLIDNEEVQTLKSTQKRQEMLQPRDTNIFKNQNNENLSTLEQVTSNNTGSRNEYSVLRGAIYIDVLDGLECGPNDEPSFYETNSKRSCSQIDERLEEKEEKDVWGLVEMLKSFNMDEKSQTPIFDFIDSIVTKINDEGLRCKLQLLRNKTLSAFDQKESDLAKVKQDYKIFQHKMETLMNKNLVENESSHNQIEQLKNEKKHQDVLKAEQSLQFETEKETLITSQNECSILKQKLLDDIQELGKEKESVSKERKSLRDEFDENHKLQLLTIENQKKIIEQALLQQKSLQDVCETKAQEIENLKWSKINFEQKTAKLEDEVSKLTHQIQQLDLNLSAVNLARTTFLGKLREQFGEELHESALLAKAKQSIKIIDHQKAFMRKLEDESESLKSENIKLLNAGNNLKGAIQLLESDIKKHKAAIAQKNDEISQLSTLLKKSRSEKKKSRSESSICKQEKQKNFSLEHHHYSATIRQFLNFSQELIPIITEKSKKSREILLKQIMKSNQSSLTDERYVPIVINLTNLMSLAVQNTTFCNTESNGSTKQSKRAVNNFS